MVNDARSTGVQQADAYRGPGRAANGEAHAPSARPAAGSPEVAPVKPAFQVPEGSWMRETSHFPRPISPMSRSFCPQAVAAGLTNALREFGFLLERMEAREIGGYLYVRSIPLGGRDGPPPPWWLLALLSRLLPPMRAANRRARDAARTDRGGALARRWWQEWRGEFFAEIEAIQGVDLAALADDALAAHLDRVLAFHQKAQDVHFLLFVPYLRGVAGLALFCRRVLGWDTRRAMELLAGLSEMSTEPARQLAELARMARRRPAVLEALAALESTDGGVTDGGAVERLRQADPEFGAAVDAYQRRFGCRALSEDVIDPTLGEKPALTLQMLRDQLAAGYDPQQVADDLARRRDAAAAEARRRLAGHPAAARFDTLLERAREVYALREDNSFPTYSAATGLTRLALLEVGRRLAARGVVDRPADVMFLELDEARGALRAGGGRQAVVERRQGERTWALANPGPATYGPDPGPPPDVRGLPAEAREQMEALFWFFKPDAEPARPPGEDIAGIPASPGRYRGPARLVRHEGEFHKLRPGDVLVCPITSPVWSALFASAGALVTDTGGALSHSAIIAREHGIPAVVATGDATARLRDGDLVTVDGSAGTVEVAGS